MAIPYQLALFALLLLPADAQPLPAVSSLLQEVRNHQRELDKIREGYTFRETQQIRRLGSRGEVKKQETGEYYVFYVNGHPIRKLIRKDNVTLNSGEQAKEQERILRKIKQAEQTPPGDALNGRREVSVDRLLTIEHFGNERRVSIDNRPAIALDFAGDPHVATHGIAEDASKHLSGTLWIDEKDRQVRRIEAVLTTPFHLTFGIFSLDKGTRFSFEQRIVNNEVWLPTGASIHVEASAAYFLTYHVDVTLADDQYRQFQTAADQQKTAPKQ